MEAGEDWAARGGVRKLVLRHPEEGVLGTIYLDLHRYVSAACGRTGRYLSRER